MKYITLVMLKQADACGSQQNLFKATFGEEAELTEANMAKAIEAGLSVGWLSRLLPTPMLEPYGERETLLWKAYVAQYTPLLEAYDVQYAALSKTQEAQHILLWEDYAAKRAPLRKVYDAQRKALLLNTLIAA